MKNLLSIILTISLVAIVFTGCKKEEINPDVNSTTIRNKYPTEGSSPALLTYLGNNLWSGGFGGTSLTLNGPEPSQIRPGEQPYFTIVSASSPCVDYNGYSLTIMCFFDTKYVDQTVKTLSSDGTLVDTTIHCLTYGTSPKYYTISFTVVKYNNQWYLVTPSKPIVSVVEM